MSSVGKSHHAVGLIARKLHGFSRILFLFHTDHTNRTEAASQGVLAAWRLRRVYTPRRYIQATARYALCSMRPLCEANIHHSVRKKQSKFCLNSVDKKIFMNIRVIRGQITSRGGFYRTQIARIFTDSFFLFHTDHTNRTEAASQGVLAAWRLRRVYTTGGLSVRIMYLCSYVKKESVDRRTKEPVYSQSSRGGFYLTQVTRIAQRLRRKECSQHGGYAECTRLVGFQ